MRRLLLIFLVASAAMFNVRAEPVAQSSFTDQVWKQLQGFYDTASDDGYSLRNYVVGSLDDDQDDFWTMTFYGGNEYMITGACDEDCSDIDLAILTEDGTEVTSDRETDSFPVVSLHPSRDIRYQVKVSMYSCAVEPCYFGFGIFYK
jgi:hypothetical protein